MAERPPLILASRSPYRRALLEQVRLPHEAIPADVDESRHPDEPAHDYVLRLARAKAEAVAERRPDALVIGSDQAAVLGERVLGKPGSEARAREQLATASGQCVTFLTGVAVVHAAGGRRQSDVVPYRVHFRDLDETTIARYVALEQPLDCAGSFKSEGLGAVLFQRMEGSDPNALIGLPLIRLFDFLLACGYPLIGSEE
ncbi:Maf family protein [Alkalilimnicola ehrlichii MLHE-1]|uniref:7-methyl-GTP pyrophosphatase n=1 Tax=Alkalilimnicola ehrlichii (strain ATCC BAA-1101 / DSM 17681 / MLHE-1) TaxID=187272 RepID=NTPPB_ALKEH|nr:nucleoside triphosphate pyrophosphatase [Alkalilimnicola ehrlichii]Q0A8R1.1 RecName: Full=7-methyl-GTP pyrophosphatase; Short=m(7)GTP pyrophosphatase [Alkalilimnicola ehrlichii MLHE-1]ABI56776.1 maf protein [Alkalilimnicola ehrlichii MLHE-1]